MSKTEDLVNKFLNEGVGFELFLSEETLDLDYSSSEPHPKKDKKFLNKLKKYKLKLVKVGESPNGDYEITLKGSYDDLKKFSTKEWGDDLSDFIEK